MAKINKRSVDSTIITSDLVNAVNGVAGLDGTGKIATGQLPSAILGDLNYQGTYDASTAVLPSGASKGYYYVISVAGTISGHAFAVGDWIVNNGSGTVGDVAPGWDYVGNPQKVTSVFGRIGAVVATSGDYTTSQVTEAGNLYFTNARAIAAPLTGFTSGAGTVAATDSVLQAIQKVDGNTNAKQAAFTRTKESHTLTSGEVTAHAFALAHAPIASSLILEWLGVVQIEGVDYSVSGSTVTFSGGGDLFSGAATNDVFYAQYSY